MPRTSRSTDEVPSGALYDDLQRANRRSTRFLLAGAVVIAAVMVWVVAGFVGLPVLDPATGVAITAAGTAVGLLFTYLAYRSGPSLALRAARARPVARDEAPELHNLLDEVCVAAGILGEKPTLHLVDDPAPNAFATGLRPEDAHIAVTTGLVERLPRYELRAVIAHEVAHIVNDDIRAVTVAVATAGLVALLADVMVRFLWFGGGRSRGGRSGNQGGAQVLFLVLGILALILAPIAAQLIRFAVSRQREYLADATASEVLRDPQSMANALRRIDGDQTALRRFEVATAHLWFEEPNETEGRSRSAKLARRFATHPTIAQRVERLAGLNAGSVDITSPLPPGPPPPPRPPDAASQTPGRGASGTSGHDAGDAHGDRSPSEVSSPWLPPPAGPSSGAG